MDNYNKLFSEYNNQLKKIDFITALKIGLTLCVNDLHIFSDYLHSNSINDDIFSCFESAVFLVSKNINCIERCSFQTEYKICEEKLENFCDEDNLLYDECVNVCAEILNLLEFTIDRDNSHILQIMKSYFENKEAFIQKNYENSDEIIDKYIENMAYIDLRWFII